MLYNCYDAIVHLTLTVVEDLLLICTDVSGTIFRLKGSVLAMSFLDCNGALIPYQFESWKDANKEKKLERKSLLLWNCVNSI